MPQFDGMTEPEIVINGVALNFGQAMTVRVALESFTLYISGLSPQERAGVFENYRARMNEIRDYMFARPAGV